MQTASLAAGLQQLGSAYQSIGETQKCLDTMTEAIELAEKAYQRERSIELRDLLIKIFVLYVQYLSQAQDFEKCVEECPRLLDIADEEHLDVMLMMAKLAVERIYLESLWQTDRHEQGRSELARQLKFVDRENKTGHGRQLPFILAVTLLKPLTCQLQKRPRFALILMAIEECRHHNGLLQTFLAGTASRLEPS